MRRMSDYLERSQAKRLASLARQQQDLLVAVRRALPQSLAVHCIGAVRGGNRLILFADSAVWATRLRFSTGELTRDLGSAGKGIDEVRVRVAQPARSGAPPLPAPRPLSGAAAQLLWETAARVPDEGLAAALRRLVVVASQTEKA